MATIICDLEGFPGLPCPQDQFSPGGGGVTKAWYANRNDILTYTEDGEGNITGLVMRQGKRVFALPFIEFQMEVSEVPARDENGLSRTLRANIRLHEQTAAARNEVKRIGVLGITIITLEPDGKFYIVGLGIQGLKLVAEGGKTSGLAQDSARSTNIVLEEARSNYELGKEFFRVPGATDNEAYQNTLEYIEGLTGAQLSFTATTVGGTVSKATSPDDISIDITRYGLVSGIITATLLQSSLAGVTSAGAASTAGGNVITFPVAAAADATEGAGEIVIRLEDPSGNEFLLQADITVTA